MNFGLLAGDVGEFLLCGEKLPNELHVGFVEQTLDRGGAHLDEATGQDPECNEADDDRKERRCFTRQEIGGQRSYPSWLSTRAEKPFEEQPQEGDAIQDRRDEQECRDDRMLVQQSMEQKIFRHERQRPGHADRGKTKEQKRGRHFRKTRCEPPEAGDVARARARFDRKCDEDETREGQTGRDDLQKHAMNTLRTQLRQSHENECELARCDETERTPNVSLTQRDERRVERARQREHGQDRQIVLRCFSHERQHTKDQDGTHLRSGEQRGDADGPSFDDQRKP